MFEELRPWHTFIKFGMSICGYAAARNSSHWETDVLGTVFMIGGGVLAICSEIRMTAEQVIESKNYSILDRQQDERNQIFDERARLAKQEKPVSSIMSLVNVYGKKYQPLHKPVFNQVTGIPHFDYERHMARELTAMLANGGKMDISEAHWLRQGNWKGTPDQFRTTRSKWEYYRIVGKRGDARNARYEVQNEIAVRKIGDGSLRLPPPSA